MKEEDVLDVLDKDVSTKNDGYIVAPIEARPGIPLFDCELDFQTFLLESDTFAIILEGFSSAVARYARLTKTQLKALLVISNCKNPDGLGVKEIADILHCSGAFITVEVNHLVKDDLVCKKLNPDDHRRVLLTISIKGQALLQRLGPVYHSLSDVVFAGFTKAEFLALRLVVSKLAMESRGSLKYIELLTEHIK